MAIDKKVLRFEIPMNDPSRMAEVDAIDELEHEQSNLLLGYGIFVLGKILLEIVVCVFKH